VELTHEFTVPVDVPTAWAAFEDISSVAECFPGAVVTSVEGDTFQGTCKVKLGPVALQYAGSGTFVERDEAGRRLVLDAKGRDKRGNGTAGAHVTATFEESAPSSTRVQVVTDLQITGKPAQFGRGVIQDVSDKLLAQFVDCLKSKVAAPSPAAEAEPEASSASSAEGESGPTDAAATTPPAVATAGGSGPGTVTPPGRDSPPSSAAAPRQEALDLGATVLPVLLKSYGKQAGLALLVLVLLVRLVRRRRR
jgi:carbon monoxide dehydrogenase subunit G